MSTIDEIFADIAIKYTEKNKYHRKKKMLLCFKMVSNKRYNLIDWVGGRWRKKIFPYLFF